MTDYIAIARGCGAWLQSNGAICFTQANLAAFAERAAIAAPAAHVEPDPRLIDSMCMRWRHDFGLDRHDDNPLSAGLTESERLALRSAMRQVWEEVVGLGFYVAAAPAPEQAAQPVVKESFTTEPHNIGGPVGYFHELASAQQGRIWEQCHKSPPDDDAVPLYDGATVDGLLAALNDFDSVAFLSAVSGDGDWADEFLVWHEPAKWLSEERACAAFIAGKLAALRAVIAEAADDIADWGAYASAYFQEKHDLAGCVAKYRTKGGSA